MSRKHRQNRAKKSNNGQSNNKGRGKGKGKSTTQNKTAARKESAKSTTQNSTTSGHKPVKSTISDAMVAKAEHSARDAGLDPKPAAAVPNEDLESLSKRLDGLIVAYKDAVKKAGEAETKALEELAAAEDTRTKTDKLYEQIKTQQAEIEQKHDEAERIRQKMKRQRSQLDRKRKAVEDDLKGLVARAEAISLREIDADAGFVKRRDVALKELDKAHETLLKKNKDLAEKLEIARQQHMDELQQREDEHRARLDAREREAEQKLQGRITELNEREEDLAKRESNLEKAQQRVSLDQQELDILRTDIQDYIKEKAANKVADVQAELEGEKSRAAALLERIQELEDNLADLRRANRDLGNQSPEAIKRQMDEQQATIRRLIEEKSNRPSEAEAEELTQLRKDRDTWQTERLSLRSELQQVQRRLMTQSIAVDENCLLRDVNEALRCNQDILRAVLDDLRRDIDERLDKHRDQPVFPQMKNMDEDPKLKDPPGRLYPEQHKTLDLRQFSKELRHRIGRQKDAPDLYYREQDIHAFLGGLAMSRLHLLQGISGIGKSSLPRRFAAAVGGFCDTVSVQAGWRDRNDLLGYFNAFEHRYYESGFVQALYKAQTPHWKDRVVIVLLDEMNLSHPEQYGADMLDVLERTDARERRFELMSAEQKGETPTSIQEGRFLPLPENVWFVGTANHDETTKDFADKTYDRSFVMELPGRPEPHKLESYRERSPLSYAALMEAFDAAKDNKDYQAEVEKLWSWMDEMLHTTLDDYFGIGFGGRLEAQIKRFVPVVLACGGTPGEALDHLVTTRLLRRLRGRHDLMADEVRSLLDIVQHNWPCEKSPADAGTKLLQRELKRLGVEQ